MTNEKIGGLYVVTALESASVLFTVKATFTHEKDLNLIVAKGNGSLEIFMIQSQLELDLERQQQMLVHPNGNGKEKSMLSLIMEAPIQGKLVAMEKIRLKGRTVDSLLLLTAKYQLCCLSWNAATNSLYTEGMGNMTDLGARPSGGFILKSTPFTPKDPPPSSLGSPSFMMAGGASSSSSSSTSFPKQTTYASKSSETPSTPPLIGLYQNQGLFKIINTLDGGPSFGDAFNVRLDILDVLDWCWLSPETLMEKGGSNKINPRHPLVAFLHLDIREQKQLTIYSLDMKSRELKGESFRRKVDDGALFLIPISSGGFVVVSEGILSYINPSLPNLECSTTFKPKPINSFCVIDEFRYLLGDGNGNLFVMVLVTSPNQNKIYCSPLGVTCLSTSLTYLLDGRVYVGSFLGDSQLIQLLTDEERNSLNLPLGCNLKVLETFPSLGPISDFCVVEREGQSQVVACCGAFKDASLRIVRNGIGIESMAELGEGLANCLLSVWSCRSELDEYMLLLSFANQSKILTVIDGCLQENTETGLITDESTVYVGESASGVVQAVSSKASLANGKKWKTKETITHAILATPNILVIVTGSKVTLLDIKDNDISESKEGILSLESPIACIYANSDFIAVGLWSNSSIQIYDTTTLELLETKILSSESIARSIIIATLESSVYLLVAMGDGDLFTYTSTSSVLGQGKRFGEARKTSLGTQPTLLTAFSSNDTNYIFASTDRPTVIYSRGGKLHFSSVNLKNIVGITSFSAGDGDESQNSLAIATHDSLMIGAIEAVQKLHVKTVPVGETCRRIVEWEDSYCVITARSYITDQGMLIDNSSVCLFDGVSFEVVDKFQLQDFELANSVYVGSFSDDPNRYLVVGTAHALPDLDEPKAGRILVFTKTNRKLQLISEFNIDGCAYSMLSIHEKLFVGVNSKIIVLDWDSSTCKFVLECSHHGHVMAYVLASRGGLLIVGDLMKSVICLFYDPVHKVLSLHAKDRETHWMTGVESLSSDCFIGSDSSNNIFTLRKDPEGPNLVMTARYHLGDLINRFRRGSLLTKAGDSPLLATPELIFVTVAGSIGVVATLSEKVFQSLDKLQNEMRKLESVGNLSPTAYRAFKNEWSNGPSNGVIDGDLIESFIDLSPQVRNDVANAISIPITELNEIIMELVRVH